MATQPASNSATVAPEPSVHPGFFLLLILAVLPAVSLFLLDRWLFAAAALVIPVAICLATMPKYTMYLFFLSVAVYLPYHLSGWAIHPFDLAFALFMAAIVLDFTLHAHTEIRRTGLDLAFLALIIAAGISAVFAYDYHYSFFGWARLVVMYFAFRAVFKMALDLSVRKVVLFYIYQVFALSLLNCGLFLITGGSQRIFGPAWLAFETFSMTALPMALAFFIWAADRRERLRFGVISLVILIAIFATQSRAPLLAVAIAIPTLMILAYYKIRREQSARAVRTLGRIITVGAIAGAVVVVFSGTLFLGSLERVSELIASITHPQGTVALRIVLWTAAIKGFLSSPITGVGIGNFKIIEEIVPEIHMQPVWYYISTMSAHNVVLQYLAETGILGTLALLVLAFTNLRMAWRSFRRRMTPAESQISAALFIASFVFCVTIFYMRAWTWGQGGYIMVILFAFNAAWHYRNRHAVAA